MNPQRTASDILDKRKNLLKAVESALIERPQHMIDWPKVNLQAQAVAQQAYRIASFFRLLTGPAAGHAGTSNRRH
jgi:hypothetical protein